MTISTLYYETGSTGAVEDRMRIAAMLGAAPEHTFASGASKFAGDGHGVVTQGDFLVTQDSTPSLHVKVAPGAAFIRGGDATNSAVQGVYSAYSNAIEDVLCAANPSGNPRWDLIVLHVYDYTYDSNVGVFYKTAVEYVQGTASATPSDPAVPATSLVLARIVVPAGATTILTSYITNLTFNVCNGTLITTSTNMPSGPLLYVGLNVRTTDTFNSHVWDGSVWRTDGVYNCTASTHPVAPFLYAGLRVYESDTKRELRYDGTGFIVMSEPQQAWTPTWASGLTVGAGTYSWGYYQRSDGWIDVSFRLVFAGAAITASGPTFNLPVAPHSITFAQADVTYFDASAGQGYHGVIGSSGHDLSTLMQLYYWVLSGTFENLGVVSATAPFTWAVSDCIDFNIRYRMTTPYS
jgi:hypothetical protein